MLKGPQGLFLFLLFEAEFLECIGKAVEHRVHPLRVLGIPPDTFE